MRDWRGYVRVGGGEGMRRVESACGEGETGRVDSGG